MPHASTADLRRINVQRLTPRGKLLWSRRITLDNWFVETTGSQYCCDAEVATYSIHSRDRANAIECEPTPDGGVVLYIHRPRSLATGLLCRAAVIKLSGCGCVEWERHYGPGHDDGGDPDTGRNGEPRLVSPHLMHNFGRISCDESSVFVRLSPNHLERLSLADGSWISKRKVSATTQETLVANTLVGGTICGSSGAWYNIVDFANRGLLSLGFHSFIDSMNAETAWRWTSTTSMTIDWTNNSTLATNTFAFPSLAIPIGLLGNNMICAEWVDLSFASWHGLTVRDVSVTASPSIVADFEMVPGSGLNADIPDADPAILASTYDGENLSSYPSFGSAASPLQQAESSYYRVACGSPDGAVYACASGGGTRDYVVRRGLYRLSIVGSFLDDDWHVSADPNRMVADASGVYCTGTYTPDATEYLVWKLDHSGNLVWGIPRQPYYTPLAGGVVLTSDGDLITYGSDSRFFAGTD